MLPYTDNVVTVGMLLRGYADAVARFEHAARDDDPVTTFAPLFEALNWSVALDDRIRIIWAPEGSPLDWAWRERVEGAEAVRGIRWARNAVHHQWADAIVLVLASNAPFQRYPAREHEWVWRDVDSLPQLPSGEKKDAAGKAVYRALLEGHTAEFTLAILGEAFDQVWRFLEMPGSTLSFRAGSTCTSR